MKHRLIKDIKIDNTKNDTDVLVTITKVKDHHLSNETEEETEYTVDRDMLKRVLEDLIL